MDDKEILSAGAETRPYKTNTYKQKLNDIRDRLDNHGDLLLSVSNAIDQMNQELTLINDVQQRVEETLDLAADNDDELLKMVNEAHLALKKHRTELQQVWHAHERRVMEVEEGMKDLEAKLSYVAMGACALSIVVCIMSFR